MATALPAAEQQLFGVHPSRFRAAEAHMIVAFPPIATAAFEMKKHPADVTGRKSVMNWGLAVEASAVIKCASNVRTQ
jgi:hypothetical protein